MLSILSVGSGFLSAAKKRCRTRSTRRSHRGHGVSGGRRQSSLASSLWICEASARSGLRSSSAAAQRPRCLTNPKRAHRATPDRSLRWGSLPKEVKRSLDTFFSHALLVFTGGLGEDASLGCLRTRPARPWACPVMRRACAWFAAR